MELSPWPSVGLLQLAVLLWHLSVAAIASQFQGDSLATPEFLRTVRNIFMEAHTIIQYPSKIAFFLPFYSFSLPSPLFMKRR